MRNIRFRERDKDLRDNWKFEVPESVPTVHDEMDTFKTASLYDRMEALAAGYEPPKPHTYE